MAIDPTTTITVKVGELTEATFNSTDLIPHEVGGFLKKGTLQDLATFIGSIISVDVAVGFRAIDVADGETLPATDKQEFILVGPGTYPNVGGGDTITTTGSLNALVSNGVFWFIGVEIPINVDAIWGNISGVLSDQTDLWNILEAKADLIDGKVPNSQLPSYVDDVIEVNDYASLPTIGETGKIYVTKDNGNIYRWSGSVYIRISDESPVWGIITGTLSDQTDLQNALDGKFDVPTGDTTQYIAGDGSLITFPVAGQAGTLVRLVLNNSGATITKGTVVYINGASGNKPTIAKAIATGDATSAQTFGLVQADIANNSTGYVVVSGDLIGLNTSLISEGTQLYLSSTTAGAYTTIKQYAPAHLVYIGIVTRSHASLGQIEVKIQNGYELDELHDVSITSKSNNEVLVYESSSDLWKNKSLATVLGYTPANDSNVVHLTGNETIDGIKTFIGSSIILDNSSGTTISTFKGASTTVAEFVFNSSFTQFRSVASGGYLFKNSSSANSLSITDSGNATFLGSVTSTSIIKSGGTSSQFLKADGSVDSSTYASDSLVVKLAGSQTITGSKLFTANTSFQGATIIDYIGGISLKQTGLSLYNQMVAVDGGFNFYENAGTVFSFKIRPEYISFGDSINNAILNASNLTAERTFDLPNASGTIALTSNIPSVSGTTNYIPKFTGANSLGNSLIYDNGTNVGIGTPSPASKLHINLTANENVTIGSLSVIPTGRTLILQTSSAGGQIETYSSITGGYVDTLINPSGGNVGIGTPSPAEKLSVAGAIAITGGITGHGANRTTLSQEGTNGAYWQSYGANTSTAGVFALRQASSDFSINRIPLFIDTSGNVGIGTPSPVSLLTVGSSSGAVTTPTAITMDGTYRTGALSFDSLKFYLYKSAAESYGFGLGNLGEVTYWAGTTSTGVHAFYTSQTERMRITSGGNVGIGTPSPTDGKLQVAGYTQLGNTIAQTYFGVGAAATKVTSNGSWAIGVDAADGSTERMRIFSSGNVFIGSSPVDAGYKLDVNGNGRFSSYLDVNYQATAANGSLNINSVDPTIRFRVSGGTANKRIYELRAIAAGGTNDRIELRTWNDAQTSASSLLSVTNSGNVGIGTESPSSKFDVVGSSWVSNLIADDAVGNSIFIRFNTSVTSNIGSITRVGSTSAVSYNTTSDYRLKEDFKNYSGLDLISNIKTYDFKWKNSDDRMYGVIAHELQEVVPYAVNGEKDAEQMQQVDYSKLVPILVKSIQELKAEIEILKNK